MQLLDCTGRGPTRIKLLVVLDELTKIKERLLYSKKTLTHNILTESVAYSIGVHHDRKKTAWSGIKVSKLHEKALNMNLSLKTMA